MLKKILQMEYNKPYLLSEIEKCNTYGGYILVESILRTYFSEWLSFSNETIVKNGYSQTNTLVIRRIKKTKKEKIADLINKIKEMIK